MAQRRMFAKTIIDSDAFLDMPVTSQLLYFHLSMRADDDGFINKPKTIMRMCCCKDDDLNLLIAKKFIIPFASGVVVIKHWKIHNYIAKDRYTETKYKDEKSTLFLDENNAYSQVVNIPYTECIQDVTTPNTQVRLGKVRLGKDSLEGEEGEEEPSPTPTITYYGEYGNVSITDEQYKKLQAEYPSQYQQYIDRLSEYMASSGKSYKNHYATIRAWIKEDAKKTEQQPQQPKKINNRFHNFNQRDYDKQAMEQILLAQNNRPIENDDP